jgi:hypothetical protein
LEPLKTKLDEPAGEGPKVDPKTPTKVDPKTPTKVDPKTPKVDPKTPKVQVPKLENGPFVGRTPAYLIHYMDHRIKEIIDTIHLAISNLEDQLNNPATKVSYIIKALDDALTDVIRPRGFIEVFGKRMYLSVPHPSVGEFSRMISDLFTKKLNGKLVVGVTIAKGKEGPGTKYPISQRMQNAILAHLKKLHRTEIENVFGGRLVGIYANALSVGGSSVITSAATAIADKLLDKEGVGYIRRDIGSTVFTDKTTRDALVILTRLFHESVFIDRLSISKRLSDLAETMTRIPFVALTDERVSFERVVINKKRKLYKLATDLSFYVTSHGVSVDDVFEAYAKVKARAGISTKLTSKETKGQGIDFVIRIILPKDLIERNKFGKYYSFLETEKDTDGITVFSSRKGDVMITRFFDRLRDFIIFITLNYGTSDIYSLFVLLEDVVIDFGDGTTYSGIKDFIENSGFKKQLRTTSHHHWNDVQSHRILKTLDRVLNYFETWDQSNHPQMTRKLLSASSLPDVDPSTNAMNRLALVTELAISSPDFTASAFGYTVAPLDILLNAVRIDEAKTRLDMAQSRQAIVCPK